MSDELDPKLVERARKLKQRLMATADQDARLMKRRITAGWLRELGFPESAAAVEKLPLTEHYFPLEQPEPELEDDYEALGYPETRAWEDDLDTVRHWAECSRRVIMPKAVEWLSAGERRFVIEHPFAGMDKEKP